MVEVYRKHKNIQCEKIDISIHTVLDNLETKFSQKNTAFCKNELLFKTLI